MLRKALRVQIQSLLATQNFLREVLHLNMIQYHRCSENHIMYCGRYERHLKYPYCHSYRFFEHTKASKGILASDDLPDCIPTLAPDEEDTDWLPFRGLRLNAVYHYIPLIHRLRLLYANPTSSEELQTYLTELRENPNPNEKRDVWDGLIMSQLRDEGIIIYTPNLIHSEYFSDIRDIALQLSLNGVQLFKIGTH